MASLPRRRLGGSELEVPVFALGSWQTYERIPREQGAAVLRTARVIPEPIGTPVATMPLPIPVTEVIPTASLTPIVEPPSTPAPSA